MTRLWLLVGFVLASSGCSSDGSETPSAVSPSTGTSGASAAGTSAAVGGAAGRATAVAGRGTGQAGSNVVASAAGAGGSVGGAAAPPPPSTRAGSGGATQAGRAGGDAAGTSGAPAAGSGGSSTATDKFSFFVTSLAGLKRLSKSDVGFGGDLRYGQADGLAGADKICTELAESSMPGAGAKGWRAFLSVAQGPDGGPVHAIDRVGAGPWYDRIGRVLAMDKASLLNARPKGADPAIINDLPNEEGVPNQRPDPAQPAVNNHHFLTGSDTAGKLYQNSVMSTCNNWTSADRNAGRPRIGFSYPAGNRQHWISGQDEGGCSPGAVLVDRGGSDPSNPIVGSGGGYGGFYCFALKP